MDRKYDNFDLLIEQGNNSYSALILNASFGQGERSEFTLPFTQEQLASFAWLSGRSRHLRLVSSESDPKRTLTPRSFGEQLYQAVFQHSLGQYLRMSYQQAHSQKMGLRLRLNFSADVAELADLPWEFLWTPNPVKGDFLALHRDTPIIRFPRVNTFTPPFLVTPPLRILVMLSNPSDVTPLDVNLEFQRLEESLAGLLKTGTIQLEKLEQATLRSLSQRLRAEEFHIFHFMGHGFFNDTTGQGGLVFEDETGTKDEVSAEELWNELRREDSLRLIFLNACEGARSSRTDFFAGVAQQLVQKGVPAVLAMQFEVSDQAAIALAESFYYHLAEGQSLDAALAEARTSIVRAGNELEWATPVLFSRLEELNLLGMPGTPGGPTYSGPTYPRSKAELQSLEIQIPAHCVVRSMIFAPRSLTVGEHVTLEQPIYARGDIHVGQNSHIKSHIFADGSVLLEAGVVVEGDIIVKGAKLLLGDDCRVRGAVRVAQIMQAGTRCFLAQVYAPQVELGVRCKVDDLAVTHEARLHDGVFVGKYSVGKKLILSSGNSDPIEIQQNTLVADSIEWPEAAKLNLGGKAVDRSNLFLRQNDLLVPGPTQGAVIEQPLLITTLLNAELVSVIRETTTVNLRLPKVAVEAMESEREIRP